MSRAAAILITLSPALVLAHGAPADGPIGAGELVDESYTIRWQDHELEEETIEWHYSGSMPPQYFPGVGPHGLDGPTIVEGIAGDDPANAFEWDTRDVPAGTYFLWSRGVVVGEVSPYVSISRGVLTIAHPGDDVPPAIVVSRTEPAPEGSTRFAVELQAFDPDGTGRVRLEASPSPNGDDLQLVAEDLAPDAIMELEWDASEQATGYWTLKATIAQESGASFSAFGETVYVPEAPEPDAGTEPLSDGGPDAAGIEGFGAIDSGCGGCSAARAPGAAALAWAPIVAFALRRRRARRYGSQYVADTE